MNKQEVFNKVRDHLLKQNMHSTKDAKCAYRGDNGLMCAAGCLIPDELYNPSIDATTLGAAWPTIISSYPDIANAISTDPSVHALIHQLQMVHDIYNATRWAEKLTALASRYGLQP